MSLLNTVITGRKLKPLAFLVHAEPGMGKTKFAEEWPSPIFVGPEENDEIDSARFPKVESWIDLENQLKTLLKEKHNYKTVVIDTVTMLQQTAAKKILTGKAAGKTMQTAFGGYGKANRKMEKMFQEILDKYLIPLRDKKGMNVLLLSHSKVTEKPDPETGMPYLKYETGIQEYTYDVLSKWVSAIFFISYQMVAKDDEGKNKVEQLGDSRVIYTQDRLFCSAKNRFNLPYEIEFKKDGTFKEISRLVREHYNNK